MDFLLSTSQLRHILSTHTSKKRFKSLDVCAINELPDYEIHWSRPGGYIVNSDPNFKPGRHWVAIYLPALHSGRKETKVEFFDPYGCPPSTYGKQILQFIKANTNSQYVFNTLQVQPNSSTLCGLYCCYFILNRLEGEKMEQIINRLLTVGESLLFSQFQHEIQPL